MLCTIPVPIIVQVQLLATDYHAWVADREARTGHVNDRHSELRREIFTLLSDNAPWTVSMLAQRIGKLKSVVRRAMVKLEEEGTVIKCGYRKPRPHLTEYLYKLVDN